MGFYVDFLKNVNNDNSENIETRMIALKKAHEKILSEQRAEMENQYRFYVASESPFDTRNQIISGKELGELTLKKEQLENLSVPEYFSMLFKNETSNLTGYISNSYTQMGEVVEQTGKLNSKGLISTWYELTGKKDKVLEKLSDNFNSANLHAKVGEEALAEWENMSYEDRTLIMLTRWEQAGNVEFSPKEMDDYAKFTEDQLQLPTCQEE